MDKVFFKSPLNYIGGKYKLLPQILNLFPKSINNFIDLFAGGLDVSININANRIFSNDINIYLIELYKKLQSINIEDILLYIDTTIKNYNLSNLNKNEYLIFRKHYNNNKNPLDLYILICYSFNHQIRFNNKQEFNVPFGLNRSSFNNNMRQNLIKFHSKIHNNVFQSIDFKRYDFSNLNNMDFVYADPPYLISCGTYNDGKRGFNGWNEEDDINLLDILDSLNQNKVKFALSNITEHKGIKNKYLIKWQKKYNTHSIFYNYNNSSYNVKNKDKITKEVLITNF